MTALDDYCDLCDLPKSQCVHGRPPPAPQPVTRPAPRPRTTRSRVPGTPAKPAPRRRWTPPEVFKPLILSVLEEAGGRLDAEDVFLELEILADEQFLPGDRETTPEGELRWQYAARRARALLLSEGLMTKGAPGVWQLSQQ